MCLRGGNVARVRRGIGTGSWKLKYNMVRQVSSAAFNAKKVERQTQRVEPPSQRKKISRDKICWHSVTGTQK